MNRMYQILESFIAPLGMHFVVEAFRRALGVLDYGFAIVTVPGDMAFLTYDSHLGAKRMGVGVREQCMTVNAFLRRKFHLHGVATFNRIGAVKLRAQLNRKVR